MNADGSGKVNITNSPGWESSPDWSPNGKKIAYSLDQQIVVANADGSNPRVLTQDSAYSRDPAWSPKGRKIAFSGNPSGAGSFDILVINADGSHQVNLTRRSRGDERGPSWSPDGKKIAFSSGGRNEDSEICVMKSNGTEPRRLTNLPSHGAPAWSPDGAMIAYGRTYRSSAETFSSEIWVMRANGSRKRQLAGGLRAARQPAWSPSGERIAFSRNSDTDSREAPDLNIWVMNADGSGLVDLGDDTTNSYDSAPEWSPDGKKIVFQRGQTGSLPTPPYEGEPEVTPCKLPPAPPRWRCHVPRVVGLQLATARIWIRDAACAVGLVRRVRSKSVGRVISQYPRSGAVRALGGKVNLVVGSRGPPG
jgi:Tol biopolymer transport system component